MTEQYANAAQTRLAGPVASGDATFPVASTSGGFPTSGNFRVVLGSGDPEVALVTAVSSGTFAVTRAAEAYAGVQAAQPYVSGELVTHVVTAGSLLALAGSVSGQIGSGQIASGAVGPFQLSSGAVRSGHVGDAAIVSGGLASGNVGWAHLASGAVRSGHVGDGAIVSGSVASGQLGTVHIASGGLGSGAIGSGQVDWVHCTSGLVSGLVLSGGLGSGQVGIIHLASGTLANAQSGSVGSGAVGSGAVQGYFGTVRNIASGTVGVYDFGSGAVLSGAVASGQIGQYHFGSGVALLGTVNTFTSLNSFSGTTTFDNDVSLRGGFFLNKILLPPQITADQNDYSPTGLSKSTLVGLTSDAARAITGIANDGNTGRVLVLVNRGSFPIILRNNNAGSAVDNRFTLDGDLTLTPGASVSLAWYTTWYSVGTPPTVSGYVASGSVLGSLGGGYFCIASGTIGVSDLASGLVSGLIQSGQIGSGQIAHPHFGSGAILSGDIASGQIGQYHFGSGVALLGVQNIYSQIQQFNAGVILNSLVNVIGEFAFNGVITPAQITADQNDYSPTGINDANLLVVTSDAARAITGIVTPLQAGRLLIVLNAGSNPIVLKNNTTSTADYRFSLDGDLVLNGGDAVTLIWRTTWHAAGTLMMVSGYVGSGSVLGSLGGGYRSIASGTVGPNDLGSGSITSGAIASGQVGVNHLSSGLVSGLILSGRLGSGQVGTVHLASGTLSNITLSSGNVGSGIVASGSVQGFFGATRHIASGTVGSFDFGSGAVIAGTIGSGAVQSGNLASGAVGGFHLADGAVTSGDIASGQVDTYHLASGALIGRAAAVAPFASGGNWTVLTAEGISGVRAVALTQSGRLQVAMASVSGRMPAVGVVTDNVASGIQAQVYSHLTTQFASGLADYSGYLARPLFVGRSGQVVTISGSFNSGGFQSGDVRQVIGLAANSGGAVINTAPLDDAAGVTAASQADQEAGTRLDVPVTPGRQQYHPSAAKAWAKFAVSAGTLTLKASYNCTASRNGTGDYTVTFTVSFSSADYVATIFVVDTSSAGGGRVGFGGANYSQQTGSFRFRTSDGTNYTDMPEVHIAFFGDQ